MDLRKKVGAPQVPALFGELCLKPTAGLFLSCVCLALFSKFSMSRVLSTPDKSQSRGGAAPSRGSEQALGEAEERARALCPSFYLRRMEIPARTQGFITGALGSAFLMTGDLSPDLNSPDFSMESTANNM
jgi:hypothetical protein